MYVCIYIWQKIFFLFSIIDSLFFSFISEISCSYPYFFLAPRKIRSLILHLSRPPILLKSFHRRTRFPTLVCISTPHHEIVFRGVCLQIRCTYTFAAAHLQHAHCDRHATADDRACMLREHQAISMPSHRSLAVSDCRASHRNRSLYRCITQKKIILYTRYALPLSSPQRMLSLLRLVKL